MDRSVRRRWAAAMVGALTMLGVLPAAAPAVAEPAGLFFSEYVEGSSNNKALEIYNGTGATVDLSAYRVQMYFNGSAAPGLTVSLAGSVAAGDVFVLAHASAAAEVLAAADQTNGAGWFNGDDAVALVASDGTAVDVVGQVGVDPGTEWGTGNTSTADNTLRRKASVTTGDPDGSDAFDPAAQWDGFPPDTFAGLGSHGGDSQPEPLCDTATATPISAVQGAGAASPVEGQTCTVEAVVTAVKPDLRGFYVQEEAADVDDDPASSEGLFVFTSGTPSGVRPGDVVRVTGQVQEFSGQTQIRPTSLTVVGTAPPVGPTPVTFPLEAPDALERHEGMLVELSDTLVISEYFNYDRFGEVVVAKPLDGQPRLWTPTAVAEPGAEATALAAQYATRRIVIDDSSSRQNPSVLPHPGNGQPFSLDNRFRGGDTVTGVAGVLDHTFGAYRVQPTRYGDYAAVNPRPAAPEVGGSVTVASFNVLNYFL
ncbi:MAG: lamin tail domain-containing protein, partial [Actinomycetota bacterium]